MIIVRDREQFIYKALRFFLKSVQYKSHCSFPHLIVNVLFLIMVVHVFEVISLVGVRELAV
jgi:hypothetical protein